MTASIHILPYQSTYHSDFKRLNLEWLERFNLVEDHDLQILDDPQGTVLDRGGFVWLAMSGGEVIGTAGIMKEHEGVYELIKMSVTEQFRGRGISKLLLDVCLEKAKELGAKQIILFSNSQLTAALKLYEKYGFEHVSAEGAPFVTADVKMKLVL